MESAPLAFADSVDSATRAGRLCQSFDADYRLQSKVLGRGAAGLVRRAVCRQTGRKVAVKSYDKRQIRDSGMWPLVKRELDIHQGLAPHRGIVQLADVYETEDCVHMVMEELLGGELYTRVSETGPLCEPDAAYLAQQVLEAVAYLHAQQVVHRDIKMENIVYKQRKGRTVKLIDFGASAVLEGDQTLSEAVGTPGCAAPEVLAPCGAYDGKADLWSVGSVFFEVLTAQPAIDGDSTEELWRNNRSCRVNYSPNFYLLSSHAQNFLRSLLCADPAGRPSAQEALRHPWLQRASQAKERGQACGFSSPETLLMLGLCFTPFCCFSETARGLSRLLSGVRPEPQGEVLMRSPELAATSAGTPSFARPVSL